MGFEAELRGNLRQFPGFPGPGMKPEEDRSKWEKYSDVLWPRRMRWWVEVWKSPEDAFVWTVEVEQAGYYEVFLVGTGRKSEVKITAGNARTSGWVNNGWDVMWDPEHYPPRDGKWHCEFTTPNPSLTVFQGVTSDYFHLIWSGWDRIPMGTLYLPARTNTITVHAGKVGAELALYSLELVPPEAKKELAERAAGLRSSTRWLADAKYGLFIHWTSFCAATGKETWRSTWPRRGERKPFPQNVDDFDVDRFVEMISGTGAGYIIFTSTWADLCFPAPITAIDKALPGRTSKRDLLMEIADGLERRGIRMMFYYHFGGDEEWWAAIENNFIDNWCALVSEVGLRYGEKLAGWWFDDSEAYYERHAPFERMTRAAKAGNPHRLVTYNAGAFIPKLTEFQDYLAGEGPQFWTDQSLLRYLPRGGTGIIEGGRQEGLQAHVCFGLEKNGGWIHNRPNSDIGPPFWDEELLTQQVSDAAERKFVPSIGIEVYQDGTASPQTLELLGALRKAVKGGKGN